MRTSAAMRAQHVFLGLGFLLALGASGCGDDSAPTNQPSNTGGKAGHCLDQEKQVDTKYVGAKYTGTPSEIASQCTKAECIGSDEPAACVQACVLRETNNALTPDCASCFSPVVVCGLQNCMDSCYDEPAAPICSACLCNEEFEGENSNKYEENCIAPYEACSGLKSTKCQ